MQLFAPTATAPHAINFLNTNSQKQSVAKSRKRALVLWFDETGIDDVPLVGGKNASLGEMHRELTKKGVRIPDGFATTAFAYRKFMEEAGIKKEVRKILKGLDVRNYGQLSDAGSRIRRLIINSKFPEKMGSEILRHYAILGRKYGMKDADVAVRSSATAEDLPNASFAGQRESYLNVRGEKALLKACKKCIASLFTNRAIAYRQERGFNHFKVALSIGIQKMVRSDRAGSGVMFTIDTESGFNKVILIDAGFGLGENIVKGRINPDEYYVFKETLDLKYNSIISKKVGSKTMKMVYSGNKTRNVSTSESERRKFVLNDNEIMLLARWGKMIEDHYSAKHRRYMPMDVEWAKDGISGKLFIVQARPETVQSRKDVTKLERYVLKEKGHALVTGSSVGSKISSGKVHIIESVKHIKEFKPGEVLVTQMTDPDWVPVMKMASAIVTNRGGKSCHAAIVSRELGVTCVVGTNNATKVLKNGEDVTVSCAEGEQGYVYDGKLRFEIKKEDSGADLQL